MVPTPELMLAALGTTMFPGPFCTMTVRRELALGTMITGLPGVTAAPFTATVGELEFALPGIDELATACDLDEFCARANEALLFDAAFDVALRPDACDGATDVDDAVATGAPAGAPLPFDAAFSVALSPVVCEGATDVGDAVTIDGVADALAGGVEEVGARAAPPDALVPVGVGEACGDVADPCCSVASTAFPAAI